MIASAAIDALGWALLHFIWQGALVACASALGLALLRHARPQQRYLFACLSLLLCLLLPALEFVARLHAGLGPVSGAPADGPFSGAGAIVNALWLDGVQAQLAWIVGLWALCAAGLALRMVCGLLLLGKISVSRDQQAHHAVARHWQAQLDALAHRFGLRRPVRLYVGTAAGMASPVTAGWLRPLVIVPASLLSGMPAALIEALLAHELAHIERHDYLVNLLQTMIEIVLFYHPAVWWLSRQVRVEREQIADDRAAAILGEPRRLALALSELDRFQSTHRQLTLAANGGLLMARIQRLVRPDTRTRQWKAAALPLLGLAGACIALAAHGALQAPQPSASASASGSVPTHTGALVNFNSCAKPMYPAQSLANKEEGTVKLSLLVSADGKPLEAQIKQSSGSAALDTAVRDAILLCSFTPATRNNQPIEARADLSYVWTLK